MEAYWKCKKIIEKSFKVVDIVIVCSVSIKYRIKIIENLTEKLWKYIGQVVGTLNGVNIKHPFDNLG